jgi:Inositol-pentakisphosphate 2-kinase
MKETLRMLLQSKIDVRHVKFGYNSRHCSSFHQVEAALDMKENDFVDQIAGVLCSEPFLKNLKEAIERLDIFGIVKVYESYQFIIEREKNIDLDKIANYYRCATGTELLVPRPETSEEVDFHYFVVATYLMAKTLRDCSFILSLKYLTACEDDPYLAFEYKIQVIDLDQKSPYKIPLYYKLHQDLVDHHCNLFKMNINYRKCLLA